VIKLGVLSSPPFFLSCDLQEYRLRGNFDRRESNTILLTKVAQGFDAQVLGVEPEVVTGNGSDALDPETALGAIPQ
jgi:hypothetical protein